MLRMDLRNAPTPWLGVLILAAIGALLQFGFGWVVRLHHGRAPLGSFAEALVLGGVTASVGFSMSVANMLLTVPIVPRTVPVAATFMTLALTAWARATWRRLHEKDVTVPVDGSRRALILGAGDGGRQLVNAMLRDRSRAWHPVGLLDDDLRKRHRRVRGVPVLGTIADLARVVRATGCESLIVAIPSANAELIRAVGRRASDLGIDLKVLPGVSELLGGRVAISDIRDIEVTDLLGRHQVDTDVASVAGYLTGRRVLVTGAGGSIGSELCRQIHRYAPAELIMLDRDESALHAVQLSIHGRALLDSPEVVLADIRDTQRIFDLFAQRRPEVVFHAAALKHLPMLEQYPGEAVKTNVWGTQSVLEAAMACWRRAVRQHLDGQGGQPLQRSGLHQATRRRADGGRGEGGERNLPQRTVRQRPRQPWFRAHRLHGSDQGRRPGDRHGPRGDAVLHDRAGGRRAGHPGGCDRR